MRKSEEKERLRILVVEEKRRNCQLELALVLISDSWRAGSSRRPERPNTRVCGPEGHTDVGLYVIYNNT